MAKRKRGPGRPALGKLARTESVLVRLTPAEHKAILAAVARENAEAKRDGLDDGATVSSWMRDHALDPLGDTTFAGDES